MAQLQRWVYVLVAIVTMLFAIALQEADLIATKAEGNAIKQPAARLLAQIEWVRLFLSRYGHLISNADDALLLLMAISMYAERVAPILGQKFAHARGSRDRQAGINRGILRKGAGLFAAGDGRRETGNQTGGREQANPAERAERANLNGNQPAGSGGPGAIVSADPFGLYSPDL